MAEKKKVNYYMSTYPTAGRPKINVDKKIFEELCELQCTLKEVAGMFHCSESSIEAFCRREYDGKSFKQCFEQLRTPGLVSLRRSQMKLAEKNGAVNIWVGKQYLGQKDSITINNISAEVDDDLTKSIKDGLVARGDLKDENEIDDIE